MYRPTLFDKKLQQIKPQNYAELSNKEKLAVLDRARKEAREEEHNQRAAIPQPTLDSVKRNLFPN